MVINVEGRSYGQEPSVYYVSLLFVFLSINLPAFTKYPEYAHAYNIILHLLLRASIANAIAIAIGSFFNIYLLSKWKMLIKGKYFWLRSLGSSAIGESFYTIFVVSLVNVGLVNFNDTASGILE